MGDEGPALLPPAARPLYACFPGSLRPEREQRRLFRGYLPDTGRHLCRGVEDPADPFLPGCNAEGGRHDRGHGCGFPGPRYYRHPHPVQRHPHRGGCRAGHHHPTGVHNGADGPLPGVLPAGDGDGLPSCLLRATGGPHRQQHHSGEPCPLPMCGLRADLRGDCHPCGLHSIRRGRLL